MKSRFLVCIFLSAFFSASAAWASSPLPDQCSQKFAAADIEIQLQFILNHRFGPIPPSTFSIAGQNYQSQRILGRSSNFVSQGIDSQGNPVVIKKLFDKDLEWIQLYERLVTEYYLLNGRTVPRVIAFDPEQKILIKEYFEGVTPEELELYQSKLLNSPSAYQNALLALVTEKDLFIKLHPGFQSWVTQAHPELSPRFFERARRLIQQGDLRDSNFIYDVRGHRWLLFDP